MAPTGAAVVTTKYSLGVRTALVSTIKVLTTYYVKVQRARLPLTTSHLPLTTYFVQVQRARLRTGYER